MSSVPFLDLSRIHKPLTQEIQTATRTIIDASAFVLGEEVGLFEKQFASFVGTNYSVGVASGLDALKLALLALGVGPGDEVILPANTFIATAFAVSSVGATPVLVDIDEATFTMDVKATEQAITKKTKALLPVHLYGQAADMSRLNALAKAHGLKVVEDCAQAHGATHHKIQCGNLSSIGCFSFYPTKNLGAMGDGGAITTNDPEIQARLQTLRNVGQKDKNQHVVVGFNSRLDTIQAAILRIKLPHLNQHNASRIQAALWYRKHLKDVPGIVLPATAENNIHVYHLYVVRTHDAQEREALRRHLTDQKIGVAIHYPTPIHLQECYAGMKKPRGSFPVSERSAESILSLPMFPGMTENEVSRVAEAIQYFYRKSTAIGA